MKRAFSIGIGIGCVVVGLFVTSTPGRSQDPSFTFGAAGDFEHEDQFKQTVKTIASKNPDFMVLLGDLSYDTREADWCNFWRTTGYDKLVLLSGNHDSGESRGGDIAKYITHCRAPSTTVTGWYGKQYFFDFPATAPFARFIMVSPGVEELGIDERYDSGRPGFTFTENAINEARTRGIKWIVVGMHKNYISPMEKDNEVSTDSQRTFMTMLLTKRVDVILQGHEHGYGRTKQVGTNSSTCRVLQPDTFNSACVTDQDNTLVKGAGTVIHILGTGGQDLRHLWTTDSEFPYFAASTVKTWGFGQFTVTPSKMTYTFQRSAGQAFTDSFTIQ